MYFCDIFNFCDVRLYFYLSKHYIFFSLQFSFFIPSFTFNLFMPLFSPFPSIKRDVFLLRLLSCSFVSSCIDVLHKHCLQFIIFATSFTFYAIRNYPTYFFMVVNTRKGSNSKSKSQEKKTVWLKEVSCISCFPSFYLALVVISCKGNSSGGENA